LANSKNGGNESDNQQEQHHYLSPIPRDDFISSLFFFSLRQLTILL
jgi:hypothetical protein